MEARGIPERYKEEPELVAAVIEARTVQMETEDTPFAVEWLMEHHPMTLESATKVLEDQTFRYKGLYPEGHPGLEALLAERRVKGHRAYNLKKLRPQIIERDAGRCQSCHDRVDGRAATVDHKDPEGPETLENLHLLCRKCNTLKGKRTWEDFQTAQLEWQERLADIQNARADFICKQTGLSVRGRSWQEAGCLSPDLCIREKQCSGEYATRRFYDCPCHHYGCPPGCIGCDMCRHDEHEPTHIACPATDGGIVICATPQRCRAECQQRD